ncbi:MAG: hypothetical protein L0196_10865 [candidate division Zixibacteria bacterium]|nr:hypothetical protein [candidate division Zixibacteria bacterium]
MQLKPTRWHKTLFLLPAGALLLFLLFISGCEKSVKVSFTTRDIIRFLIRDNPGIFSNSFLDTSRAAVAGTDFSFSRNFTITSPDTAITLNDLDTVDQGGVSTVVPRAPRDAGAEILDTLVGQFRIDSAGSPRPAKSFKLPVFKFGYFQKLDNDSKPNRGWFVMGATQTFVGVVRLIDTVHLHVTNPNNLSGYPKDLLAVRQDRNTNLDPLDDPQVVKVRTSPFQLKPNDSVEVRVRVRNTLDTLLHVFCHIGDLNAKRRIQLTERVPGEFFGGFKVSPEVYYDYRRLVVDAFTNNTLANPSTFQNEIWGIIYQVYP